jgi:hypothetical protein
MPYLLAGTVGFLIYRGVKKNQAVKQALAAGGARPGKEGESCSDPPVASSSRTP